MPPSYDIFYTPVDCSPLFHIAPIGKLGAHRESLSSLLIRIARAHAISPRDLLFHAIAPRYPEIQAVLKGTFFRSYSGPINGLGKYATNFAKAIGELAAIPKLECHTLLPLRHLIASQGSPVLHSNPRWCRECLIEMIQSGVTPHRPLLWSMSPVQICPSHSVPLDELCPHCQSTQPVIPRWPDIDYCDACRRWLLDAPATLAQNAGDLECNWRALACADLLSILHEVEASAVAKNFLKFLTLATDLIAQGNRAELCRRLGISIHALNKWAKETDKVSLDSFLRVLYAFDVLPSDVLMWRSELTFGDLHIVRNVCRPPRAALPTIELCAKDYLAKISEQECPPTLSKAALVLGLTRSGFKYRHPEICAKITRWRRDYVGTIAAQAQERKKALIVEVVNKAWASGTVPRKDFVEKEARKRGFSLMSTGMRQTYHQALADTIAVQETPGVDRKLVVKFLFNGKERDNDE